MNPLFEMFSMSSAKPLNEIAVEPVDKDADPKIVIDTTKSSGYLDFLSDSLNEKTYLKFLEDLSRVPEDCTLTIEITTRGGALTYALLIANAISRHKGTTIARIPKYAMSGGTIIALVCDKLQLSKVACLGPIDPHVYSFFSLPVKYVKPVVQKHCENSICCDLLASYLNGLDQSFETKFKTLLRKKYTEEDANLIYDTFYNQCEHNLPIFPEEIPKVISLEIIDIERPKIIKEDNLIRDSDLCVDRDCVKDGKKGKKSFDIKIDKDQINSMMDFVKEYRKSERKNSKKLNIDNELDETLDINPFLSDVEESMEILLEKVPKKW